MSQASSHRSALITGCSSGFGYLIAQTLGGAGYRVYATMRNIADRNAQVAAELTAWGKECGAAIEVVELDVDSEASVNAAVTSILAGGGRIDIVVNNAAITAGGPIEAFDFQQLMQVYNTNLFGPWRVDKAVLPHMRARRSGLVIHVTSVVGRVLCAGSAYAASKWAAEGLAESMAHELRPLGIDLVILEPGAYPTAWIGRGISPSETETVADYGETTSRLPQPVTPGPDYRYPDPQEIADEVLRLCSLAAGERPLRTVVGHVYTEGVGEYNQAYEIARSRLLGALRRPDQALPWLAG